ncbi:hypothetical protein BHE74_00043027 [Ensete ventricosum]|nr:hypothetical protein BHE74_00043027 [Ensete ventricosum]
MELEEDAGDRANNFGFFSKEFVRRRGLHLPRTTTTWFFLDIAFYSQNLPQKDIFNAIGWIPKAATMNTIEEVLWIARVHTHIAFIDVIGRFWIQVMGFFMMTAFMLGLAYLRPLDHPPHRFRRHASSKDPSTPEKGPYPTCGPHATASQRLRTRRGPSWLSSGSSTDAEQGPNNERQGLSSEHWVGT